MYTDMNINFLGSLRSRYDYWYCYGDESQIIPVVPPKNCRLNACAQTLVLGNEIAQSQEEKTSSSASCTITTGGSKHKMMKDRKPAYTSFLTTLVVCWATTGTLVSSFQPSAPSLSSFHPVIGGSCPNRGQLSTGFLQCDNRRSSSLLSRRNGMINQEATTLTTIANEQSENKPYDLDEEWKYLSARIKRNDVSLDEEYQRRKHEWAVRYTSVEALRETFGSNKNKLWGDLQAGTARRLYKTLLPRALLELSKVGALRPEDLAPLAYEARVAAKLYARERSTVPLRLAATLFDGFRQWKKYGKFQGHGLTYDQIWKKYEAAILKEANDAAELEGSVDARISQLILERACHSNEKVDAFALSGIPQDSQKELLEEIHAQLQEDVYQLLFPDGERSPLLPESISISNKAAIRHFRTLRMVARAKQKLMLKNRQRNKKRPSQQPCLQEVTVSVEPWNNRQRKTANRPQTFMNRSQGWLQRTQ